MPSHWFLNRFLIVFSYQDVLFKAIPLCTVDMLWNLLGPFETENEKYRWLPKVRSRDTKNDFDRRFSFAKKKRLTKQYRWLSKIRLRYTKNYFGRHVSLATKKRRTVSECFPSLWAHWPLQPSSEEAWAACIGLGAPRRLVRHSPAKFSHEFRIGFA